MKAPGNWTAEGLFEGRPEAFKLFKEVEKYIRKIGPVEIEAAKTQVSFGVKRKFAWVWLPQMWIKKRPEESIVLTFGLPRKVKHSQIEEVTEPRPGRWIHHILIDKPEDINKNVIGWLKEARKQVE